MSENQTEVVKFLNYLSNPNALSNSDLSEIKDWVAKYPYSQSLKFIVLTAAQKHANYQELLAQAATIAPSRKLLYDFIHQPESFNSAVLPFSLEDNQTIDERQIAVAQEEGNPVIEHQSNLAFGIDINEIFGSDFKPDKVIEEKNEVISAFAEKEIKEEIQEKESKLETESIEEESEVEVIEEEVLVSAADEPLEEIEQEQVKENIEIEIAEEKALVADSDEPLEEIAQESSIENIEEEISVSVEDELVEEIQKEIRVENIEKEIVEEVSVAVDEKPSEANQEETDIENIEEEISVSVEDEPVEEIPIENIEKEVVEEEVSVAVDEEPSEANQEETDIENIEEKVLAFVDDEPVEQIQEELAIENIQEEVFASAEDEPLEEIKEIQQESPIENIEEENVVKNETSVFQYSTQTDFFALNRKDKADEKKVDQGEITVDESVSAYNDESLPYTFLWWLNKTRKEHAINNQPYHSFKLDTSKQIKIQQSDGLNHQIAENIFHLRGVENLGSTETNFTVPFDFRKKEFQIIDKFIKEEPQIRPPAANKIDSENKAKKSSEDANQVVSETLAKIYVEQMLYHKALDVYKKLSLKFPEKSTYFASQIKYLELKVN